ncbi:MAG: hypothetical protein H6619_06270 [Deltaproteobacteria bacterium]|nr:hypothetical protein [Deltaproteobacteria bacterium]
MSELKEETPQEIQDPSEPLEPAIDEIDTQLGIEPLELEQPLANVFAGPGNAEFDAARYAVETPREYRLAAGGEHTPGANDVFGSGIPPIPPIGNIPPELPRYRREHGAGGRPSPSDDGTRFARMLRNISSGLQRGGPTKPKIEMPDYPVTDPTHPNAVKLDRILAKLEPLLIKEDGTLRRRFSELRDFRDELEAVAAECKSADLDMLNGVSPKSMMDGLRILTAVRTIVHDIDTTSYGDILGESYVQTIAGLAEHSRQVRLALGVTPLEQLSPEARVTAQHKPLERKVSNSAETLSAVLDYFDGKRSYRGLDLETLRGFCLPLDDLYNEVRGALPGGAGFEAAAKVECMLEGVQELIIGTREREHNPYGGAFARSPIERIVEYAGQVQSALSSK